MWGLIGCLGTARQGKGGWTACGQFVDAVGISLTMAQTETKVASVPTIVLRNLGSLDGVTPGRGLDEGPIRREILRSEYTTHDEMFPHHSSACKGCLRVQIPKML